MGSSLRRNKWVKFGLPVILVLSLITYSGLVESKKRVAQTERGQEAEQAGTIVSEPVMSGGDYKIIADVIEEAEDIVYRFKDKGEIELFKQIYQTKQVINTRIAVLGNYLSQERANLEQLDAQMYVRFKFTIDPKKQYNLDEREMVLREVK